MLITHDPNKITHAYFNDATNRWLTGLTNEQHHSLSVISSSAVKFFHKKSPWAFYNKYVLRNIKETEFKNEFRMGTLIHLAILEPEKFEITVTVCDEMVTTVKFKDFRDSFLASFKSKSELVPISNGNEESIMSIESGIIDEISIISDEDSMVVKEEITQTKKVKKKNIKKEQPTEEIIVSKNGGYIVGDEEIFIIKSHEMKMLRQIQENVKNHDRLSMMLSNCGYMEQSGIAQCPKTGLFLSVRGDARSDLGYFIDPKSCSELSMHSMESSQATFNYFLQHAHYLYTANLIEPNKYDRFYFIYISKEAPYEICLTHLDNESVEAANRLYFNILNRIAECEYKQKWPTLDEGNGILLKIPRWAF